MSIVVVSYCALCLCISVSFGFSLSFLHRWTNRFSVLAYLHICLCPLSPSCLCCHLSVYFNIAGTLCLSVCLCVLHTIFSFSTGCRRSSVQFIPYRIQHASEPDACGGCRPRVHDSQIIPAVPSQPVSAQTRYQ